MLISPPFLPDRANLSEDAWLDTAMAQPDSRLADTQASEGSFPLSHGLAWHNGLHIQAPRPDGTYLPVRAIADGTVVFVHSPTPPNTDADHPLNYNPFNSTGTPQAAWTSDGFVILGHTTEIGAAGATPTQVDYFSVCIHLSSMGHNPRRNAPWKPGDAIYRKEEIGNPGQIYGDRGQIHFEICCDEANLRRFMPRAPAWADPLAPVAPTSDGRTDSVFGSVHVYLPAGTPTSATLPNHHLRTVSRTGGGASAATDHFLPDTLRQPLWIRITYDRGSAVVDSHDILGSRIGTTPPDANCEYDLYATAVQRHDSLDATSRATSSPSGWYELLRFGRNLGPDPLPSNAAHWREIPTATGTVWADLNAPGTFKFSDADFPAAMGWNCFDDDQSPTDQRCDSLRLKTLIRDPNPRNDRRMERVQLARRLGDDAVRAKLRRAVCRFPSEWEQETIVQRHGWLLTPDFKPEDDDEAGARKWARFVKHAEAISFAKLPTAFLKADWRFHPREFVEVMRKCGWLSKQELVHCIPSHALRSGTRKDSKGASQPAVFWEAIRVSPANWENGVIAQHYIPLNHTMRKYGISNKPLRMVSFLANAIQETGWLSALQESGGSGYWYTPWHGRGMLQLTHPSNYFSYWEWRGRRVDPQLKKSLNDAQKLETAKKPADRSRTAMADGNFKITEDVKKWRRQASGEQIENDLEALIAPTDCAGHYAITNHGGGALIKFADEAHAVERVSVESVNPQGQSTGEKMYYRSHAFWKTCAAVNLPGAIERTYSTALYGFNSRCSAYGVLLAKLTEHCFPDAQGRSTLLFPEGYVPRIEEVA